MGRYIAILAIIALGVGFFAGVKNTKASMMLTCNEYVDEYNLYDFRIVSTYGFTEDEEAAIAGAEQVSAAEGSVTADLFSEDADGDSIILRAHSITDQLNNVDLIKGRLPKANNECVADNHFFTEKDIGKTVKVTDENDKETKDAFVYDEYKIVGIANSPYYMMKTDRGTTSLGDGSIQAYIYAPRGAFSSEYFTEIFVSCKEQGFIFSSRYNRNMSKAENPITQAAEDRAQQRYDELKADAQAEIDKGQKELDDGRTVLEQEKSSAYSQLRSAKNTLDEKNSQIESASEQLRTQKNSLQAQKIQVQAGIEEIKSRLKRCLRELPMM